MAAVFHQTNYVSYYANLWKEILTPPQITIIILVTIIIYRTLFIILYMEVTLWLEP